MTKGYSFSKSKPSWGLAITLGVAPPAFFPKIAAVVVACSPLSCIPQLKNAQKRGAILYHVLCIYAVR
jgi:hypothetical protein